MADPNHNLKDRLLNDLGSSFGSPADRIGNQPVLTLPTIPDHALLRCIGKGSYGEVWLARNALGTFRAVKIVRRKAFDSDRPYEREFAGIRRFEPVSRSHPSQLNVLHVGRDDAAGLFYYVMELADDAGTAAQVATSPVGAATPTLDPATYVARTIRSEIQKRGRLPCAECVDIGTALATALDHLHRHGLVHRDIKPSNIIFVNGIPKLADIGLVTRLDASLSFVGTEGYLPPEGPGTPQADIYSLGKVLYEMSTGRDRQDYPELPTNLIEVPAEERTALAELNEVIVKACHTEVKHRYQTAAELHADLALLQSGKSVSHVRAVERRLRFVQRAGVLVTIVALFAGGLYFWQSRQTQAMHNLAQTKTKLAAENGRLAQENRQVAQFLKSMLESVGPSVALGRDTTLLRDILEKTAARVGNELKDQPEVEAELRTTLGVVYRDIGEYEKSEAMLRDALAIRRKLHSEDLSVADSLMELATTLQAYLNLAEAETWHRRLSASNAAKLTEAESLIQQSLELRRRIQGSEDDDIAATLGQLSVLSYDRGKLPEAERFAREGLAMARKFLAEDHPEVLSLKQDLAIALTDMGKFEEAEELYRVVLQLKRLRLGENHPGLSVLLTNLGLLLEYQDRLAEAEAFYQQALDMDRKLTRNENPLQLARLLNKISDVRRRQGKSLEAEADLREALPLKIKLYGQEHLEVAAVLDNLAGVLVDQGKLEEAEPLIQQALAMRKKLVGDVHPHVAVSFMGIADLRQHQGRFPEAEAYLREALAIEQQLDHEGRPYVPELAGSSRTVPLLNKLGRNLQRQGRNAEAESTLREALEYLRKPTPFGSPPPTATLALILHHLADLCCARNACAEARPPAEEAVKLYQLHPLWPAVERRHAVNIYVSVLQNLGDTTALEKFYREETAAQRNLAGDGNTRAAELLGDLGGLLQSTGKPAEAENAFREALDQLRKGSNGTTAVENELAALVLHHLADNLRLHKSLQEAHTLGEESVALYRRHPEWPVVERQHAASVLKDVLMDQGDFAAAESVARERLQEVRTIAAPDSPELTGALAEMALVLLANKKFEEAEPLARETLAIREKKIPDDWRTFNSRSLLGGALLGQKKYAEAEPLLVSGYEGMKQRETKIPPQGKPRLKEALQRLIQLCEQTNRPEQAAEWKQKQ